MLTVDFDRLRLGPGDLVLDMGAGAGRHAFEVYRRGADIVALDYSLADLKEVANLFSAMSGAGEVPADTHASVVNGDGTGLPFADGTFDAIICSEVMEHIPDDSAAARELARVLKPGGQLAVTVPTFLPERICWALSDEYHAPFVEGGHVRIFTETELKNRFETVGLVSEGTHKAHALHSPYWWLKCAVGPTNDDNPLVQAYLKLLTWDIVKAPKATRWTERVLNPVLGKSLVLYARKPADAEAARG
ncbi:MAG: class I SAM-dependent methyltransferase [Acidimicrobiales bacterium]|nr:class I SAM-dependent methyltransferase [Acidimicrobiales bacterium]